jgi:hypothetical protein
MAHMGENRYVYRVLGRKPEGNRDKHRWKGNTQMGFK